MNDITNFHAFIYFIFGSIITTIITLISQFLNDSRKNKQERIVREELWLTNHINESLKAITNFYFTIRNLGINVTAIIKSPYNYDFTREADHLLFFKKMYIKILYFKNDKKILEACEKISKEYEKFSLFNTKVLLLSKKYRSSIENSKNLYEINEKIDEFNSPLPEDKALIEELHELVSNVEKISNQLEYLIIDRMPHKVIQKLSIPKKTISFFWNWLSSKFKLFENSGESELPKT